MATYLFFTTLAEAQDAYGTTPGAIGLEPHGFGGGAILIAETDDEKAALAAPSSDDNTPSISWTRAQLDAYAGAHDVDVSNASTKQDVLDAIEAAS